MFAKPAVSWSGLSAYTGSAQVTIVIPTGNVTPTNLVSAFGAWNLDNVVVRHPAANPNFDYATFYMPSALDNVTYTAGQEFLMFSFTATGTCTGGMNLINNATDPFMPPNALNYNVGNYISTVGGGGLTTNAYTTNYGSAAGCPNAAANTCAIQYELVRTGTTYQVNMIPNVSYSSANNLTSTQQVTLKVPTGLAYTNLASLTSGATFIQGSRINAPPQATGNDYIIFNLSNLGTNAFTYSAGQSIPLFKFDVPGTCAGSLALMPNNDPFTSNSLYNSKQQISILGYGQPDAPICFVGTGVAACPAVANTCQVEYQLEKLANGKFQVSMLPKVTYTGVNNTTSTQQVTLKVPTGFQYTGLTSLTGATYVQGSRVNAPSQATGFDYIMFNLSNLGTTALTYTNGVKVPLFTFDKSGSCQGTDLALMPNNDPFASNPSFNSKQQLTVLGYGQPDIPICFTGTGSVTCQDPVNPATCVINYELETVNGCEYQVSMSPNVTWNSPDNITKAAKVTLRVPHNCFTVSDLTSLNFGGNFIVSNTVLAPADNPAYDYICFSMTTVPTVAIPYINGQKVPLFKFKNGGTCCGNIELMPFTDPFAHGNTVNQNFDQHWQTSGTGTVGTEPCIVGTSQPCISPQGSNLLGPDKSICQGTSTQLNVTGTFASYSWTGAGLSATNVANPTATPTATTTYYVTATTVSGCAIKDEVVVTVNAIPSISSVNAAASANCNASTGTITVNATGTGTLEYSINNGTTWQLQNVFANLAVGSYTVKMRVQGTTCETTYSQNPVQINAAGAPSVVAVNSINPTDCGKNDGQISITVNGTGGPFRYSIDNGANYQTSNMFSNRAPGTYNIKVTDAAGGCSVTYPSVSLIAPSAPSIVSVTPSNATSCSIPNGSISVVANGGTPPLEYSINGTAWQTSSTFNNLGAGSYLVQVRNTNNSCMQVANAPVAITMPSTATISNVVATPPTTCGTNNGSLTVTAAGGVSPLEYSIDGGSNWQNSPTFSSLASGTYFVMVRNAGGACSKAYLGNPVVMNQAQAPAILNVIKTTTSGCGLSDGQIVVNATGSGTLQYSINNGATWQNGNTFVGLGSGSYNIVVRSTSNVNCTSVVINCVIPTLSAPIINNFSGTSTSDCSQADGTISVSATGGTAPLQYSINGINWQTNNLFTGVAAGNYTIRVRNANGTCPVTANTPFTVTTPTAPTVVNTTATQAACGQSTGSITVIANGGVAPLQYSIDNINWQTNNIFSSLIAGSYNVFVRNNGGTCATPANNPIVVNQSTGANISSIIVTNLTTCNNINGQIIINATGGTPPLQYAIDGGVNFQTSNTFNSLSAGSYNLVVRGAGNSCPAVFSPVVLTAPSAPQVVGAVASNPVGCTSTTGSLQVLATGNGALEYSLDGITWQASNLFYNLGTGNYTSRVRLLNNASCSATSAAPVVLTSTSTPPTVTNVVKTNPSSCGTNNGSILVTATPNGGVQYSIDNIHWQTSSLFSNLASGSYTIYARNNDGTCPVPYSQNPVVLNAAGSQTITNVSLTNPSTCNKNDGQISITVTGNGGPFRYSINGGAAFQTSPFFVNLAAGSYNIMVTTSNGDCPVTFPTVNLVAPSAPSIVSATPTSVTDCNLTNGSISINATSGSQPLEYSLDGFNWQLSNTFNNLAAGSYLAAVRNSNNSCVTTSNTPITVTMPTMPSVSSVTSTIPTACGLSNGSITVSATGGNTPYQYSIDNGANWVLSNVFNNLASGAYYVMVRNNGGTCAKPYLGNPVVINATGAPSINSMVKTLPSNCNLNDASIVINASGTGTLEYSINSGASYQSSNSFNNLAAATYTISVRVVGGNANCTTSVPNCVIPAPTPATITNFVSTPTSNCNQNDGTITITATGGIAPLQYSIDGNVWQNNPTFTSVAPGTYTVRVRNANGTCPQTASTTLSVGQPTSPSGVNATTTQADCGATNGSITISATGGTPPLQYSIDNINWQTSNVFSSVAAGNYTVYARNANTTCAISAASPATVSQVTGANISNVTISNANACGTNNGSISITAAGGIAPLQYSINGGVTFQTTNTFNLLGAGTYNIVVKSSNNTCPAIVSPIVLTAPNSASIFTTIATNPTSCNSSDGTVTILATGGNAPLQYSIDGTNWQTSNVFVNVGIGSYTARVRNSDASCTQNAPTGVTLTTPSAPAISSATPSNPTTCGSADGAISLTATPNIGVEYSLDNIHWQSSASFGGLTAGTYNAYIRYANGACKTPYITPITLNATGAQNISLVSKTNPTTCNVNDGQISIVVNGTGGPFKYSIDNGTNYQTSPFFVNLAAGTYNIKVTDISGTCSVSAPSVSLVAPLAPVIVATTPTATTDCGLNDGEINITANGGVAPLEYSLDGINWQVSNIFRNLNAGSYLVKVRNNNNSCSTNASTPVQVAMPASPTITGVTSIAPASCGQNTGSIAISATGGTGQLEYSIDQVNWVTNPVFTGLASGTYFVFVRNQDNSCSKAYSGNPVVLNATGAPQITNVTKTTPSNCNVNDGKIIVAATGTGTLEYSIDNGVTYQVSNTFNGLASGTYNVKVKIQGGNAACTSSIPNCVLPTLTQPSVSNISSSNPTDCSQNDGTITVNANGGVAPLQYSLDGNIWQNNPIFLNVPAGTYTVRVRNNNATCIYTHPATVTLSVPSAASTISGVSTPATCGQTNGSITVSANGGVAPLQYSINGINFQSSNVFNNIAAGTYILYVRNNNGGCLSSGSTPVTVNQTGGANITFISTSNAIVCGSNNGSITVTATGGTPPLQYSINGGASFQAANTFNGLAGGAYNIVVSNTGGTCPAVYSPVILTAPTAPTIITSVGTNLTSCSGNDGTITVLASSLTSTLEYSLNGTNWQTANQFTGLAAGSYTVRVRNTGSATCLTTASTPIVLTAPTPPTITNVVSTNPSNCNTPTGAITVTATGNAALQYSINGTTWQNTGNFVGVTSGSYTVRVRYADGTCSTSAANPVVLNGSGSPQILTTLVVNSDDCANTNNGKITILANSNVGLQYKISSSNVFQISNIFTNVTPGTYTITVADASGSCQTTTTATLTGPVAPPTPVATANATSDCVTPNGSISVSAPLGATYEYSINNGASWQGAPLFTGVATGSYVVSVRILGTNCKTASAPINVTAPANPSVNTIVTANPSVCGASDGTITINATGGAGTYQYSIDNVNWQAANTFNNLVNGTYTVYVRNTGAVNCPVAFLGNPVILTSSLSPSISGVLVTQPSNCSGIDGNIAVTATGATEYSKDNGTTWQASNVFSNLTPGTYNLRVRSSASCVSTYVPVTIQGSTAPTSATVNATPVSSCGSSNGTIQITNVVGGQAPYEYSLNGTTWSRNNFFTGVAAGSYNIRVRNKGATCVFTDLTATIITQPNALTINNVTSTPAVCNTNNGQITVSASVGALYSIDGVNYQNSGNFANLGAGSYLVSVKNASGSCVTNYPNNPVIISPITAPAITNITSSNPTECNLTNGTISVTASGGIAPLSYSLDGGITFQASNVFNNVAAGSYSIVVRGSGLGATCPSMYVPLTLTAPASPQIGGTIATNPTPCLNDGKILILASGGNAPLQYSIDNINWQNSNEFTGLTTGNYTARVRNSNTTCAQVAPVPVTLSGASALVINSVAKTDPTTCIASNGTITITATPNIEVQYSIDNLHWQTSNTFSNLVAGAYNIYVRNANGTCKTAYPQNPVQLNGVGQPVITAVNTTNVTDCNTIDGTITIHLSSNATQFKYSIDNGANYQYSNYFTGLTAGTYNVKVTDITGNCPATFPNVVITAPNGITITSVTATPTNSCNGTTGAITINATGGVAPLQYSITNGANWTSNNVFSNLATGTYVAMVRSADGKCVTVHPTPITVIEPAKPTISNVTRVNPQLCGQTTGSITITATGGSGSYEYSIDGTNWQATGIFNSLIAGAYTVKVRNAGTNCPVDYSSLVNIAAPPAPSYIHVITQNPTTCNGNTGKLTVIAGGTSVLEYSINNGTSYQASNVFNNLSAGNYSVLVRNVGGTCPVSHPVVTLVSPQAPTIISITPTPTTDCNSADGTITVNATSNNLLEYSINGTNWFSSNVIMPVAAGTYTVQVRDQGTQCSTNAATPVVVGQPSNSVSITNLAAINTTGCGKNDGSITITGSSNVNVMYSIDGINWTTNNVFSNLPSGTYMAYIRNINGTCAKAYTNNPIILTPGPQSPSITNVSYTNTTNCGLNNGTINITATLGVPPYQYSIDGGSTWQNTANYANLAAGNYEVTVRNNDASCATLHVPVQIKAPASPYLVTAIFTKPTDCAIPNAKITVYAAGGIAPLQYSIDNGLTWTTNNTFINLGPGNYYIKIRNADGTCEQVYGPNPVKSCEFDLALRKKLTNKADSVTRLGRDIDFTIKVYNQGFLAAKDIEVIDYLPKGTILSPKDDNGWSYLNGGPNGTPVTVDATGKLGNVDPSQLLKVKKTITQLIQPGDSAEIHIKTRIVFGAAFAKLVNVAEIAGAKDEQGVTRQDGDSTPDDVNGNDKEKDDTIDDKGTIDEDDEDPAPLRLDEYDPQGYIYCDKAGTLIKGGQMKLVSAPAGGSIFFVNDANGVLLDGTNGIYQFFTNGVPGTYNVTYMHPGGYQLSTMILPQAGSFNPAGKDGTSVDKDGDGTNGIIELGGGAQFDTLVNKTIGFNPFYLSFTIDPNETTIISKNNIPVSCGCMTANVCKDLNGDGAPTVGEPAISGVTVQLYSCTTNQVVQTGVTNANGKFKFSALLAGNYKLKFVAPSGYSYATNASGQTVGIDNQGNTTCFLLDYAGCQDRTACLKVCPTVTISPNVTLCAGTSTTLSAAGGSNYTWSPATGLNTTSGASVTATPSATTTYTVTSIDGGCTSTATVVVTVVTPPAANAINVTSSLPSSCGTNNGSITVTVTPSAGLEYSINNGTTWTASNTFSNLAPGTYAVKVRNTGATCSSSYANNPIDLTPASAANITNVSSVNPNNCSNPNGSITITANGGTGQLQYSINNGVNFSTINQFTGLAAGTYKIVVRNGDNTCPITYSDVVLTTNAPIINAVNVVADCANNNRSITILASGGVAPLEYTINNGVNWSTNNVFTGLAPGAYNVAVRNFNGTCIVNYAGGTISMCNYDLALRKRLALNQNPIVRLGDMINYTITVFNQGSNPVKEVTVTEYIPTGMQLSPANNNGWTQIDVNTASTVIVGAIAPGASVDLNLSMKLVYGSPNSSLKNTAEISSMKDSNGNVVTDIDSTPDNDKNNDVTKDDVINENGKNNPTDDEDDSDIANITLDNFDPSGYIYCEKTGKIITGGKIKLVSGPKGGDIFFSTDAAGKLLDGTSGMYQIFTNGVAGTYVLGYSHPNGFPISTKCATQTGPFNPAGNDGNPVYDKDGIANGTIHLGSVANGNYLADKSCAANQYFLSFVLNPNEQILIATNNLPVDCPILGGLVFDDKDGDGKKQNNESGMGGLTVNLYDCNATTATPYATTKTDANGNYSFDGFPEGKYKIEIVAPNGQIVTGAGFDPKGFSTCTDVKNGDNKAIDGGLSSCVTITNVAILKPICTKNNGSIIIETSYQGSLQYSIDGGTTYQVSNIFTNIGPGVYVVKVKTTTCEQTYSEPIKVDCTVAPPPYQGSISGKAFKSCIDSGIKGASKGVAGVKVTLSGSNGVSATATTDASGNYDFKSLDAATYTITFEKPSGFSFVKQDQGNDDTNDSDVDAAGKTASITITGNQLIDNIDAGLHDTQAPTVVFTHPLLAGYKDGDTFYMECGSETVFSNKDAKGSDNDGSVLVTKMIEDPAIISKDCSKDGYLIKMHCGWEATDDCGNKTLVWLNIIVRDNTPPVLLGVPADITITDKDPIPAPANVTASDKCDKNVTVAYTQTQTSNLITRTWTAIDACGNKSGATQTILIKSTVCNFGTAPVPVIYPTSCTGNDGRAKLTPNNYSYKWEDGTIGDIRLDLKPGTYNITATDANGCTMSFSILVKSACVNQPIAFLQANEVRQVPCNKTENEFCVSLNFLDFAQNYDLLEDGKPYNGKLHPCDNVLSGKYNVKGLSKNLNLNASWKVNGTLLQFNFNGLKDLVAKMNQYDPEGSWVLDDVAELVEATSYKANYYGKMTIKDALESFFWSVNPSESNTPSGLNFTVESLGKHEFILAHKTKAYQDTLSLQFVCTTMEHIRFEMTEQEVKTTMLKSDELPGKKHETKVHKAEINNPAATFELFTDLTPAFLKVTGQQKGEERTVYTITDEYGIVDTIEVHAIVSERKVIDTPIDTLKEKPVHIYDAFSPNGDNINEFFRIDNIEYYPTSILQVYNRWGNLVYSKKEGYKNDWRGTFNEQPLPNGTYFFVLHLKESSGEKQTGYIQIER